jgi:hypothetical protein
LDRREAEFLHELVLEVLDIAFQSAYLEGLRFSSLEIFFLTYSGHETDNIIAFLDEPGKDTGSIEPAAVGKANPLLSRHDEVERLLATLLVTFLAVGEGAVVL